MSINTQCDLVNRIPRDSSKIPLELIKKFNNIHVQKSILFLYNSHEQNENKIKKTIPFIIASKINYLGLN